MLQRFWRNASNGKCLGSQCSNASLNEVRFDWLLLIFFIPSACQTILHTHYSQCSLGLWWCSLVFTSSALPSFDFAVIAFSFEWIVWSRGLWLAPMLESDHCNLVFHIHTSGTCNKGRRQASCWVSDLCWSGRSDIVHLLVIIWCEWIMFRCPVLNYRGWSM